MAKVAKWLGKLKVYTSKSMSLHLTKNIWQILPSILGLIEMPSLCVSYVLSKCAGTNHGLREGKCPIARWNRRLGFGSWWCYTNIFPDYS